MKPPKSDADFVNLIFGWAWTLWAPIDDVNQLCLDFEYAENAKEKKALEKRFRAKILAFKSELSFADQGTLTKNLIRVLGNLGDLDFDVVDRTDSEGDQPPGNY